MEILAFWLTLLACLACGVPVAFALAAGAFVILLVFSEGLSHYAILVLFSQRAFGGTDSFAILALPLFFLAGALMERGGISDRLIRFALVLVGWVRGGLSIVSVAAAMLFSSISGSASAATAAIGGIMVPAMHARGYPLNFAAAVVSAAGALGPIIPPSIGLVVYGSLADVSIARLFLGGVVPGILIAIGMMLLCGGLAAKRDYPKEPFPSFRELVRAAIDALIPLMAPAIILGGIFGGIFTATESAMIAVVYAFLVGRFVYRTLTLRIAFELCYQSAVSSARVMIIIAIAAFVGWVLAREQVPQQIADIMLTLSSDPLIVLLLINGILLVFGCFLEGLAIMIILLPTLLPTIHALGIDPVFFGVIMMVNLSIGTVTPPVGTCLVVGASISGQPMEKLIPEAMRFLVVMVGILVCLIAFPGLTLWLPNFVYG